MRYLVWIFLVGVAGCSLIVSSKLNEKNSDGGAAVDRGPPRVERKVPTTITGERGATGEGPYLIGEQVEFPIRDWPTAARIMISGVPCIGSSTGPTILCTVSPNTLDGNTVYTVKDAGGTSLNGSGSPIQIRRLVVGWTVGKPDLQLLDQATMTRLDPLPLGGPLFEPPKISPSGRYLLARIGDRAVLANLVTRKLAQLPAECTAIGGSSFEPEREMIALTSTSTPFMFFRPERRLWCATPGQAMKIVRLPEPPGPLAESLTVESAPVKIDAVTQSATVVELGGRRWMAGVRSPPAGKPEVFALELKDGDKGLQLLSWALPGLGPKQVVLTPLEEKGGATPSFSRDIYLVVLATPPSGSPVALLLHPEDQAPKGLAVPLDSNGDLRVESLVWMPYTHLVGLDRAAGTSTVFAYLRVVRANGIPALQLARAEGVSLPATQTIRAFAYSPLDLGLLSLFKPRVGTMIGSRIVIQEDEKLTVLIDDSPKEALRVLGHPILERLLFLTKTQTLASFKQAASTKQLIAADTPVSFPVDAALIQP